jgi:hypothetical protein
MFKSESMHRKSIGIVLWGWLGISSIAYVPASLAQQQFGVGVHDGLTGPMESALVPPGISIRADFRWRLIESTPGVLSLGAYSAYDAAVTSDVQRGA